MMCCARLLLDAFSTAIQPYLGLDFVLLLSQVYVYVFAYGSSRPSYTSSCMSETK